MHLQQSTKTRLGTEVSWDELNGTVGNLDSKTDAFMYVYTLKHALYVLFHETKSGKVESVPKHLDSTIGHPTDLPKRLVRSKSEKKKLRHHSE